jgi:hypothetical protein
MDVVTGNIPADDLRDLIQSAQSNLALAADADVLRRDPYRLILAGLSGILATVLMLTVLVFAFETALILSLVFAPPATMHSKIMFEVMAARKRAAIKPVSAAIEDISTQRSLFRAHPLSRDHNDCRAGAPSLTAIAVRESRIEIHGITFAE